MTSAMPQTTMSKFRKLPPKSWVRIKPFSKFLRLTYHHIQNFRNSPRSRKQTYTLIYDVVVRRTFNNTNVTVSTLLGKTILSLSCGSVGFIGSKRSSPSAYETLLYQLSKELNKKNIKIVQIRFIGVKLDKFLIYKIFRKYKLRILALSNATPVVFNGCRAPAKRRL